MYYEFEIKLLTLNLFNYVKICLLLRALKWAELLSILTNLELMINLRGSGQLYPVNIYMYIWGIRARQHLRSLAPVMNDYGS